MLFTLFLDFLLKQLCERLFRSWAAMSNEEFLAISSKTLQYRTHFRKNTSEFKLPKEMKNQNNFKVYAQSFVFFFSDLNCICSLCLLNLSLNLF
jgi:hypothetical protein